MKLIYTTILILTSQFFSAKLLAQDLKIGFINLPALIEASPQAISATKRLQDRFKPKQNAIATEAKRYHSLVKKLEKDTLILNDQQRNEIKAEIQQLKRKIERDEQDFREDLNLQKNNEFKKTRDTILKVIAKLAETEKFDLIITEGAIYASEKVNISNQVLELLKKESKLETGVNK